MTDDRRVRAVALGCVLVAALQLLRFADPRWAVDDAWVSFRYAKNLVAGHGLVYEVGATPVEGMTNLLWTLLSAVWIAISPAADPLGGARLVGGICHLATVAIVVVLAARVATRAGGDGAIAGAVAGGIVACTGNLAYFAMSGLETPLWLLLAVVAAERGEAVSTAEFRGKGTVLGLGSILGLLAMTRPEGVLVGGLVVLAFARTVRTAALMAMPFALIVGAMQVFRLTYYGELLPNTFHAKPGVFGEGVDYVFAAIVYATGIVGLVAAGPAVRKVPWARAVAAICVVMVAGTAWSGGDWMPGVRRLAIPVAGGALLTGIGVACSDRRAVAGALAAAWIVAAGASFATGWDSTKQVPWEASDLAAAANATPGVELVAMADIGRFGHFFDGAIFDLVGLTDPHIARLEGKHGDKAWDEAYFRDRAPDLVLARSEDPVTDPLGRDPRFGTTEHDVVRSILEGGGYRYHATYDLNLPRGRYWVLFASEDVTLPPDLWGPPPERDLRELLIELNAR